ncbi:hypothetical protein [Bacteroides salyersiae]|jgi:hypothetical protein|uniref:hypothetical protein n=1 Tax=Bacteroides salyersiae TaxID=291644 RepID=UPI001C8C2357|nr:hypothetical protein [Bacteroides salyersiae]
MKKFFLLLLLICFCSAGYSQKYISGSMMVQNEFESEQLKFSIAPEFGYHLSDRRAIGITLNYILEKDKKNVIAFQPYYRYYFIVGKVGFFLDGIIGVTATVPKQGDTAWGLKCGFTPGINFKLSDKFSFISKLGFLGYYQPDETKKYIRLNVDASNLQFGVLYKF